MNFSFYDILNAARKKRKATPDTAAPPAGEGAEAPVAAPADAEAGAVGSFITPQSITSFPVASVLVAGIWKLFATLFPDWGGGNYTLLGIAMVIGVFIWIVTISDPELKQTRPQWVIGIGIALINSLYLAASVLGLNNIVLTQPPG